MTLLITLASISFLGMAAMVLIRIRQIKTGKVQTNGESASFWAKTYEAILITESKIINFLASVFMFCAKKAEQFKLKQKTFFLFGKIFGGVRGKISDIRNTVRGEPVLSETKENPSDFLKDISAHKENSKTSEPVEKAHGE